MAKSFGEVTALAGIDLDVRPGTLAALLGPNGAGKTTFVRIVVTLTRADRGRLRVFGHDVAAHPGQVRKRVGLTGQFAGLDQGLSGRDNLVLVGRLAGLRRGEALARAAELAEAFGLRDAIGRAVRTYSGGMSRRLDIAASLMTRPALLVLDEPTTGLDPASRRQLWSVLLGLRSAGTTMLLTTQYLEEADQFADVVHLMNGGRLVASGTPARLKASMGRTLVEVRLEDPATTAVAAEALTSTLCLPYGAVAAEPGAGRLTLHADGSAGSRGSALVAVAAALEAERIAVAELSLRQPSLDDAFLALTSENGGE